MQLNREYTSTNFVTGIRAIAILLVFLIHSGGGGLREWGHIGNTLTDWGKFGVQIFFVLSGFTIYYQMYDRNYSLKRFLLVRLTRISIPYFPILILILIYLQLGGQPFNEWAMIFNQGKITALNIITHFTYLSPYNIRYANSIIGVEWTLSIEVFYYIVIGTFISKKIFKLNISYFIAFGLGLFLLAIVSAVSAKAGIISHLHMAWLPPKYGYMFILGGASFYIRNKIGEAISKDTLLSISNISILIIFFSALLLLVTDVVKNDFILEFYFALITFIAIICTQDEAFLSKIFINKLMIFLGSISYSFYLLHYLVLHICRTDNLNAEKTVLLFISTIFVSAVWYWIFENKIYNLIKTKINSAQ